MKISRKLLIFIVILLLITGCDPDDPVKNAPIIIDSEYFRCEGCHLSESVLKEYAVDETQSTRHGEFDDLVPLAPWKKVYIELKGDQESFKDIDPVHAGIGCKNCHGGQDPGQYDIAHDTTFGFVRDPSIMPEQNCNPCHGQIVTTNANSMHSKAWGQRTAIARRELGVDKNHQNFGECPSELTDGFDKDCSACHSTCGQCHLSRPNVAGGGFINNHQFTKTPKMDENCLACHDRSIATDFLGRINGNQPSVHYTSGKQCLDCHIENFHADASPYENRYHLPDLPECLDCHSTNQSSNLYHIMHWPANLNDRTLACQVCHSQPYNNCDNCHTNGEWQQGLNDYAEYPEFRIGLNIDENLHLGKWVVVRHTPISPDSYEPWGHADLSTYNERPTWEYSSPHNIIRTAPQTNVDGDGDCNSKCHVRGSNAVTNKELFLWQSFIESNYPEEVIANEGVAIDGTDLPNGWEGY